ncbi:MAG: zinc metallopeptidase [Christensenellaceae bacterium]|nr:zinc metallopeptidase [Christensenellaceae bacterium]
MPYYGINGLYWDPMYLVLIGALLLSIIAQSLVSSTYRRYSAVKTMRGITSADAARTILSSRALYDVRVETGLRALSDHYDPKNKVIRLGGNEQTMSSVAAVAVAAHECGHAIQHAEGYGPLKFRTALVPVVNFTSRLALPLMLVGWILGYAVIAEIGMVIFGAVLLFQLVTLPVEFNASKRALACITDSYMLTEDELKGAKKVLTAAAFTYVAAALVAMIQFLRFASLAGRRR